MKKKRYIFGILLYIGFLVGAGMILAPISKAAVDFSNVSDAFKQAGQSEGMKNAIDWLTTACEAIGGVLACIGAMKAGVGYASDDPQQLSRGMSFAAAALALAGLSTFFTDIGMDTSPAGDSIDDLLSDFSNIAKVLCSTVGGVMAAYGGISAGIAYASDNPEHIPRGIKFLVGGLITLALTITVSSLITN